MCNILGDQGFSKTFNSNSPKRSSVTQKETGIST